MGKIDLPAPLFEDALLGPVAPSPWFQFLPEVHCLRKVPHFGFARKMNLAGKLLVLVFSLVYLCSELLPGPF